MIIQQSVKDNTQRFPWRRVPSNQRRRLQIVRESALKKGVTVYAVGGWVRDVLLRRSQKDIDFVCEEFPDHWLEGLAQRCRAALIRHERFMTARLIFPDGCVFDFVRARKETYDRPGALPRVSPGTLHDDLWRRDFTINALAVPLEEDRIIDPTGGLEDLRLGWIRILHKRSFCDDPTRMLRAVRFQHRFQFRLTAQTATAMRQAICEGALHWISRDRYTAECRKAFSEPDPLGVTQRWHRRHLDELVCVRRHPDWSVLRRFKNGLQRKSVQGILKYSRLSPERGWFLSYVLCSSNGLVDEASQRWGLTREEKNSLNWLCRLWPRRASLARMGVGRLTVTLLDCPDDSVLVMAAAGSQRLAALLEKVVVVGRRKARMVTAQRLRAWGCPQGEICGRLLEVVRRFVAEDKLKTIGDQRAFVANQLKRMK